MSGVERKKSEISRRDFLRGKFWRRGSAVEGSTATEIAAQRARFANEIRDFVERNQHEHALDLITRARIAEAGKVETGSDEEKIRAEDQVLFLDELRDRVVAMRKSQ